MVESGRRWGPGERRSLREEDLARCAPIAGEGGRSLRAYCPFHGSDRQRSLRVTVETGQFKCFACGAWGYLERVADLQLDRVHPMSAPPPPPLRSSEPMPPPGLAERLRAYQDALPGSAGETYLAARRIPLALVQRLGVGYAAAGRWAHVDAAGRPIRDWPDGRLVFPHTDLHGRIVNLYGRAVGDAPKEQKHDHLAGAKGYFNAP